MSSWVTFKRPPQAQTLNTYLQSIFRLQEATATAKHKCHVIFWSDQQWQRYFEEDQIQFNSPRDVAVMGLTITRSFHFLPVSTLPTVTYPRRRRVYFKLVFPLLQCFSQSTYSPEAASDRFLMSNCTRTSMSPGTFNFIWMFMYPVDRCNW